MKLVRAEQQPPIVEWITADGIFIKQMFIAKAGTIIPQHSHEYDHTSMLAVGSVWLWKDGVLDKQYHAPTPILIKAGVKHVFQALDDGTTIYCIHNLHGEQAVKILEKHDLLGEV